MLMLQDECKQIEATDSKADADQKEVNKFYLISWINKFESVFGDF